MKQATDRERGTTVVEGALTLLTLLVFVLGIIEVGRFLNVQGVVTNAAREGARLAVAPAPGTSTLPSPSEVDSEVRRFLAAAALPSAGVSIQVQPQTRNGVQCTEVIVQVPYSVMSLTMFAPLQITLTGDALMRNETSP